MNKKILGVFLAFALIASFASAGSVSDGSRCLDRSGMSGAIFTSCPSTLTVDADTLQGHSYSSIVGAIAAGDSNTLLNANAFTQDYTYSKAQIDAKDAADRAFATAGDNTIRSALVGGILVPAHSLYANVAGYASTAGYASSAGYSTVAGYAFTAGYANVAGYAIQAGNANTLDGWHKSDFTNYVDAGDSATLEAATAHADAGDALLRRDLDGTGLQVQQNTKDIAEIKAELSTTNPDHTFDECYGVYFKTLFSSSSEQEAHDAPVSVLNQTRMAVSRAASGKASGLTQEVKFTIPKEIYDPRDAYGRPAIAAVAVALSEVESEKFPCAVNATIGSNPNHYIRIEKQATSNVVTATRVDNGEFAGIVLPSIVLNTPLTKSPLTCTRVGGKRVSCV